MNRCVIPLLTCRCIPNRSISLLLQANLASDDSRALRAWRNWLRVRSVEDATWSEARLLAPLARRIGSFDSNSPFIARLEGMAKAYWTQTQLIIRDSASAIDILSGAGIDCLLLKGAAYYAEGLAPASRRIMGAVDVLVPADAVSIASNRLCEAGWSGDDPLGTFNRDDARMSANYLKGEFGDIDLHRHVFHFSRRDPELDADLWKNARPARLAGRCVLIPNVADSIVISVAHGIGNPDSDWALDIDYLVRKHLVEWDHVALIAERRGLVAYVLAGLTYLKSLGSNIPQSVLHRLGNASPTVGEYLKYFNRTLGREVRTILPSWLVTAACRIAKPLVPRDQYHW